MWFNTVLLFLVPKVLADRWLSEFEPVRGVNLGSLFIIEPWMTSSSWNDMGCGGFPDEWTCVQHLGQERADTEFKSHWDNWITYDDVEQIKSFGLNTIRVPVGFWIIESLVNRMQEFYPQGGLPFLDRVVGWAADIGLHVIIDLHGAPGSQSVNQPFTGHAIKPTGFYTPYNYERAYKFLEQITQRIHTRSEYRTVGVLEVLNEPIRTWESAGKAADMISTFYPQAYQRIRQAEKDLKIGDSEKLIIEYMGSSWGSGNPKQNLPDDSNLLFDDHKYYQWSKNYSSRAEVMNDVCSEHPRPQRVVVGECSMVIGWNHTDASAGQQFSFNSNNLDDEPEKKAWYKSFWAAQAKSYERGRGWIFWTWKRDYHSATEALAWSYQFGVRNGVIPGNASEAAGLNSCEI